MANARIAVKFAGPLFVGSPTLVAGDILNAAVGDAVAEGEREVKTQLYYGHGLETGHYRRSVHGEVVGTAHGVIHDSNVVYGPWLEGVSSRNARTRFKGYAMFRNAYQKLERIARDLLRRRVERGLRRLN